MGAHGKIFFFVIVAEDPRFDDSCKCIPVFAAQRIHVLSRSSGISVTLHIDKTNSYVFVVTIYWDEDLFRVPQCVMDGPESSLTILNHMFCQYDCYCESLARFVSDSNYEFLCCSDNCTSPHRTIIRHKDCHLDNLFSDC